MRGGEGGPPRVRVALGQREGIKIIVLALLRILGRSVRVFGVT